MLKYQDATARIKTTKLAAEARVANAADLARLCINFYEDYRSLDADAIFKVPSNELGRLFTDAAEANACGSARSGDVLALYSYKRVMSNSYMRRFCDQYDVPYPTYPSDWDDIVVRYIETPSVSDFKNIPEQTVGQVQMLAARATHQRHQACQAGVGLLPYRIRQVRPSYRGRVEPGAARGISTSSPHGPSATPSVSDARQAHPPRGVREPHNFELPRGVRRGGDPPCRHARNACVPTGLY